MKYRDWLIHTSVGGTVLTKHGQSQRPEVGDSEALEDQAQKSDEHQGELMILRGERQGQSFVTLKSHYSP